MTEQELAEIRARDAQKLDPLSFWDKQAYADRRALLAHIDELRREIAWLRTQVTQVVAP